MAKKILVIGGTYFAGRVFSILAARKGYELTFLNRGKYSMQSLGETVREYKADRRNKDSLKEAGLQGDFDAIADFCAYEPGDIAGIFECLPVSCNKYFYLSTADVYEKSGEVKTEESKRKETPPSDPVSLYAYKKRLLEDELVRTAEEFKFAYTILRPAFIYGPYNYAPRESVYIRSLIRNEPIYQPSDANGQFQMVYVKDVAEAIFACMENEKADNQAFNLSAQEILDYPSFLEIMEKAGGIPAANVVPVTVQDVIRNNLPLPFPLTKEESELFDGSKAEKVLGLTYTPILDGMTKTFAAFRPVFE